MGSGFATRAYLAGVLHEARMGGITASATPGCYEAYLFSRDALLVVRDLLGMYPHTARENLLLVPQWQGVGFDDRTEEQPGRLSHQVFRASIDGCRLSDDRIAAAANLAETWGIPFDNEGFAVYNNTDGQALYVDALARFVRRWDAGILSDRFLHRPTGELRTVADAGIACADWILTRIEQSDLGLVEASCTNPKQTSWSGVLRDGLDSYYHPVGERGFDVNSSSPMAFLEVQGRAYDALLAAASLFPDAPSVARWVAAAKELPARVLEHFWMDDLQFFAAALDRDPASGAVRQVRLESSAAFELLATRLLRAVPEGPDLVQTLVSKLYSPDFMTAVGPSMLHRSYAYEGDLLAYQGARTSWGVVTGTLVEGLSQWGLGHLAEDLGVHRLLAAIDRSGPREHWYFDPADGRPVYVPRPLDRYAGDPVRVLPTASVGPTEQSWTASAGLRVLHDASASAYVDPAPGSWQASLCRTALAAVADTPSVAAGASEARVAIDEEKGQALEEEWAAVRADATPSA